MKDRVAKSLQPLAHRKISFADLQANVDGQHGTIELVAIIDHKVYLNKAAVHPLTKHIGWYTQLSQVLLWLQDRGLNVPDCMFTIHFDSHPRHTKNAIPAAPSLALASSDKIGRASWRDRVVQYV